LQTKTKIVCCHTAYFKPVKQEVNCITVILPPLVFPTQAFDKAESSRSETGASIEQDVLDTNAGKQLF